MEDKKNLQDKELEKVSGGLKYQESTFSCGNCDYSIEVKNLPQLNSKKIEDGCNSEITVYKCPGCGKWIDEFGKVYE